MKKLSCYTSTEERFSYYSSNPDENGCINWLGQHDKNGYGRIKPTGEKRIRAHRYSYQKFVGSIPEGCLVCHKCDNPSCVNHEHLFIGTPSDNTKDMHKKGRAVFNMKGLPMKMLPNSKLTKEDVLKIRELIKEGKKQIDIAALFKIHRSTVLHIKKRFTWYHI
jgi:hypothetical protein